MADGQRHSQIKSVEGMLTLEDGARGAIYHRSYLGRPSEDNM